ncbi:uncharacterized protein LOC125587268 [Brassica napus]|uniref:uncharacterized protein LOC125587268 n=1 Tax=Brassica napus TaxID=3708 RepID=UPI00207A1228|nr:uncharacterized protein LOC125587268 [Brassica napus]
MRLEHSCEITYWHAWEAREFAIAAARGIPDRSYAKIPAYLHMIKEANPGTHTHYETDEKGRFMYLFVSFGQSVRGFYNAMRRVIVVDGNFLKNKYRGVLLVATTVDDRNASISKAIGTVYPQSAHGICIHYLLTNVVAFFKTKGLTALVEKASRAYMYTEFQERITEIFEMSPELGRYLREADVRKWARSLFPGERYDIRTTNPAESINSVLRIPREYLVEKKIDRRIVKAKGFQVYKVDDFKSLVKGDIYDCHIDLERRTCTCGKYNIEKIPCRHAIPAIYSRGMEVHRFTDGLYTTAAWRTAYAESINPIAVPECEWNVPTEVKLAKV